MTKSLAAVPPMLLLALAACEDAPTSVICPADPAPSVLLEVRDAATGDALAAEARGTWTAAGTSDTLRHMPDDEARMAAYGPPGAYTLRVTSPGYVAWERAGVRVSENACGPATVRLPASLRPAAQASRGG